MVKMKKILNTIINQIFEFDLLTYFDPFLNVFWLFLPASKWRENPQTEGPQIFATLKSDKYI